MKSIMESFSPTERAEMQAAADKVTEASLRLLQDEDTHMRAVAITLVAVVGVAVVLSLFAEWVATL